VAHPSLCVRAPIRYKLMPHLLYGKVPHYIRTASVCGERRAHMSRLAAGHSAQRWRYLTRLNSSARDLPRGPYDSGVYLSCYAIAPPTREAQARSVRARRVEKQRCGEISASGNILSKWVAGNSRVRCGSRTHMLALVRSR